jgi:hypothetical protein
MCQKHNGLLASRPFLVRASSYQINSTLTSYRSQQRASAMQPHLLGYHVRMSLTAHCFDGFMTTHF